MLEKFVDCKLFTVLDLAQNAKQYTDNRLDNSLV